MDKIFIFGGFGIKSRLSSCLQFDTSDFSWKGVSGMKEVRSHAACAVFEERIVVCGGGNVANGKLKSVESYDVIPDKWWPMPSMNKGRNPLRLVVVGKKLFVVSESTCEV